MTNASKSVYQAAQRLYVSFVPQEKALSQEGLSLFTQKMVEAGYAAKTQRLYHFAARKMLKRFNVNLPDEGVPFVPDVDVRRHRLTVDQVGEFIEAAKSLGGFYTLLTALSTTYGLRRQEMANYVPGDYDPKSQTIKIRTAKGGRQVVQRVPKEIQNHMIPGATLPRISRASVIYRNIARKAGVYEPVTGWHSIRRALVTELLANDADKDLVESFMRWKSPRMVDLYGARNLKDDTRIFEKHPFLKYW